MLSDTAILYFHHRRQASDWSHLGPSVRNFYSMYQPLIATGGPATAQHLERARRNKKTKKKRKLELERTIVESVARWSTMLRLAVVPARGGATPDSVPKREWLGPMSATIFVLWRARQRDNAGHWPSTALQKLATTVSRTIISLFSHSHHSHTPCHLVKLPVKALVRGVHPSVDSLRGCPYPQHQLALI